ncbi:MAG: hypothetical protein IH899_00425 [Planctomycetes bacterium]|nr:hypothetical protein [Planctomycetota bacterium]
MSAITDPTTIEGQLIDRQSVDVGTTQRGRRFTRRLNAFVREALHNTMDTHAQGLCREPMKADPVSRRPTKIHTVADDDFPCGGDAAFLCDNEPANQHHLAKADRRIAHALNNELPRLYKPGGDGSAADVRGDESKYMAPKYKNLDSLLRYVETDSGQGTVKVVIMNFND